MLFSYGSKMFSEVGYFLFLLESQNISHNEKLEKLRLYSLQLSRDYFLSHNPIIYKHLLYEFYNMTFVSLK